jgi:8-oxo-dGTP pyrophosphatase MutT (NUDIX family)
MTKNRPFQFPLPHWDPLSPIEAAKRPRWQSLSTVTVFENPWLRLERTQAIAPTGAAADYALVRFQNIAVGVLPLFDNGDVALVGQMRFAFDAYSFEMPEGGCAFSESPIDGAKRELAEEAGIKADNWREVLRLTTSNSVTDEMAVCYLATGLSEGRGEPDPTEVITTVRLPFKTALRSAICGEITDALTVATLLRAYQMVHDGELGEALTSAIMTGEA